MTNGIQTFRGDINNDGFVDTAEFKIEKIENSGELSLTTWVYYGKADTDPTFSAEGSVFTLPQDGAEGVPIANGFYQVNVDPTEGEAFADRAEGTYSVDVNAQGQATVKFVGQRTAWLNGAGEEVDFYPDCAKFGYRQQNVPVEVSVPLTSE